MKTSQALHIPQSRLLTKGNDIVMNAVMDIPKKIKSIMIKYNIDSVDIQNSYLKHKLEQAIKDGNESLINKIAKQIQIFKYNNKI